MHDAQHFFEFGADRRFARIAIEKGLERLDVAAGHEVIAGATEDDDADSAIGANVRRDLAKGVGHVEVNGVQRLAPVEGDAANSLTGLGDNGVVG